VTVIATGLDDERMRRGRDSDVPVDDRGKVMRLRREPAPVERTPISAERPERSERAPAPPQPEQPSMLEPLPESNPRSEDWVSPFEDELDVPTFLRRGGAQDDEEDEDRDRPAFLRRSAD